MFIDKDICFYSEDLVSFYASINLHPTNPPKWEDWSGEIQSQEKLFHNKLLQDILGNPHKKLPTPESYSGLDYAIQYSYNWGEVWSGYDGKSGSSSIVISFGSRLKNAQDDYKKNFKAKALRPPQKKRPTKHALDAGDSATFTSIFLALGFSCSQTLSTPAPAWVTQTVER